jgi:hypothetical protein
MTQSRKRNENSKMALRTTQQYNSKKIAKSLIKIANKYPTTKSKKDYSIYFSRF